MIDHLRHHLSTKLLLSYLAVILVGLIVLIISSQFILPTAFNRHMAGMMANGTGMGMGGQGFGRANATPLYLNFRAGFNEALLYAALAAIVTAIILSFYLSRNVITSIRALSQATQRIADGRYEERVQVPGEDEIAQLAAHFNQMAQKLTETESMRRQLIGDVSHELRTPLTAIKGSMEGLIDGVLSATTETYEEIHAEADRLSRLVDDLQELSRVEAHAYPLDIRALDVSALIRMVTKRLASQAESKHITLEIHIAPNLPSVLADEDRTIQILTNLTSNALQYTPTDGQVTISAQRIDEEIQFSVNDNGVGIPAEHLAHIFDRFYRVDKSRSRQAGGGSGIGLTIARALVEAQGGRMWAESAGEGNGSTFHFTLPVPK